jgi:hypothetical protein
MKTAIIVDIDGTVATRIDRGPFEYDKVGSDAPKKEVIEVIVAMWRAGHEVIFVSARDDSCMLQTLIWLKRNCPPFRKLHMRKTGDVRDDAIVKREIYESLIKPEYNVVAVFDDRNKVVDMWREIGLTCLQVDYGDF